MKTLVSPLRGSPWLPGDKSISIRGAILGALANGRTLLAGYSQSDDCRATLNCIEKLGVSVHASGDEVEIKSRGWKGLRRPIVPLDAGNSGTTMRLLAGALSACPFDFELGGDESLNGRPMQRILTPLIRMGAEIESEEGGLPPLRIHGSRLHGIRYRLPVASAQVKSCVLLAGLMAKGSTIVVEETPSRDHTERVLPVFGADFSKEEGESRVEGPAALDGVDLKVPRDFSGAVFFIVAALLCPGSRIELRDLGVNPTRTAVLDLLESIGAPLSRCNPRDFGTEPVCDLLVESDDSVLERFPSEIGGDRIPNLIDEIPALAILGSRLPQGFRVRDASELRKKECDRIRAIVENLGCLGVSVEEQTDGFYIPPGQPIRGGNVRTFGDHRIAMSFAVANLISQGPVVLDDPGCAAVSFPGFFDTLQQLST